MPVTHTYENLPASSDRDAVRFLTQDTTDGAMRLSDQEIAFLLSSEANVYMAAARAAEMLSQRSVTSKSIGELSLSYSAEGYDKLASILRSRGRTHQTFSVGGLSISGKAVLESDTDAVTGFRIGMHDDRRS